MRRTLHIAFALSAFALGLVVAGASAQLPYALPAVALVALGLAALWKRARLPRPDAHHVKVAAITLVLWTPLLALFFPLMLAQTAGSYIALGDDDTAGSCIWLEDDYVATAEPDRPDTVDVTRLAHESDSARPCRPGASDSASYYANVIWAGAIDRKAVSKPEPVSPQGMWDISSTVAVAVVVDGSGRVIDARPLSGHPLLRHAAARAACDARFSPMLVNGVPPLVSGLLTYRFGR